MRRLFVVATLTLFLAACQTVPVYTVENSAILTSSGKTPTLAQVRSSILQAAASKTCSVKEIDSNTLVARVGKNTIEVVVTIKYSRTKYSILYRDSTNLSYRDGMIRTKYNFWVKKLQGQIQSRLVAL